MQTVARRGLEIAAHWPGNRKIGPVLIPHEKRGGFSRGKRGCIFWLENPALGMPCGRPGLDPWVSCVSVKLCPVGDSVGERNNLMAARSPYQAFLPLDPSPAEPWVDRLSATFADTKRTSGFLPLAETAIDACPGDPGILTLAATAALLDQQPERAKAPDERSGASLQISEL